LDHFSSAVVGFEVFKRNPSSADICALLDQTARRSGSAPKYTVTDRGSQFQTDYSNWCAEHGVKPRFGAIGQHGSLAVIERFIGTLKREGPLSSTRH
jgi:transposase InsO family protein